MKNEVIKKLSLQIRNMVHSFQILLRSVILATVIVLTIIGTFYEISLERRHDHWYRKHRAFIMSNNNDGDAKIITPLEKMSTSVDTKTNSGYRNNLENDMENPVYRGGNAKR